MSSTYWRESSGAAVASDEALRTWAAEAYDVLSGVASRYGRVISPGDLATRVQDRSGIRTKAPSAGWLTRVLTQVAHRARATGVPPLTSLVVSPSDGSVGVAYSEVLRLQGLPTANERAREVHAAESRLACYRRFAPDVPASAQPVMGERLVRGAVRKTAAPRTVREPRSPRVPRTQQAAAPATTRICPVCFLETPVGEECQNCL